MRLVVFSLFLLTFSFSVFAEDKDEVEIDSRYVYIHSDYIVNDDATHTVEHKWAIKVLNERALKNAKKTTISYSTSIQKAEVLAAYTQKADGRRMDAPKTNYQQSTNSGKDKNAPVFSDRTRLTVVFPEVQVGDTVVFNYKITQTEAMFPGQFSARSSFSPYYPYDDVQIRLDVPESLDGHYQVHEMAEKITREDGRKIIELTFTNKIPRKRERRNYSVWDPESAPGYAFSTFTSYQQIAETYGERANPKAKVTDEIIELATEIVADVTDKREQARLLYEWVATNISYAGNCIGVGAVVPHDLDFVLANRMGDCKDHATLLQALLSAQEIESTQALINSGSVYKLPTLPMVSSVNHVISYLPEFDLFVDSTDPNSPFGTLPFSISDKPVLLVNNFHKDMKTPVPPVGTHQQHMKTIVTIKDDGSASGEIEVKLKGRFAVSSRARLRNITKLQEEEMFKKIFRSESYLGTGSWVKEDPKDLLDTYAYTVKFNKKEFIQRPGAGAFYVRPLFPNQASVYHFISSAVNPIEDQDIACSNGASVEEYTYIFPKDITLLSQPDDVKIKGKYLHYSATYMFKDNVLSIVRKVDDMAPGNICSPDMLKQQRKVGLEAIKNLKSQVIYK